MGGPLTQTFANRLTARQAAEARVERLEADLAALTVEKHELMRRLVKTEAIEASCLDMLGGGVRIPVRVLAHYGAELGRTVALRGRKDGTDVTFELIDDKGQRAPTLSGRTESGLILPKGFVA